MTGPSIVPMTKRHLREVLRIDEQVYPTPWSRDLWLAELARDQRLYLAALMDGHVVGYAGALFALEDVHVMTLVSRPDRHREGIGTRLLLEVVARAVDQGCNAMTLEVRAGNQPAQALYRCFGMVPAGVRRGYYEPDNEDAFVMWVREIDSSRYRERLDQLAADVGAAA